jgi:hypothetical protein
MQGLTHILCFDAVGQHLPGMVREFRRYSETHPDSLTMGELRFGADATIERVYVRHLSNALVHLETFGRMRCDTWFGIRIYPVKEFFRAFFQASWGGILSMPKWRSA